MYDSTNVKGVGSSILKVTECEHKYASSTKTVYCPTDRLLKVDSVSPVFHKKVYGAVPPEGVNEADPLASPLQITSVIIADTLTGALASSITSNDTVAFPFGP